MFQHTFDAFQASSFKFPHAPLPFVCFNTHLMLCKHLRLKFLMHHYRTNLSSLTPSVRSSMLERQPPRQRGHRPLPTPLMPTRDELRRRFIVCFTTPSFDALQASSFKVPHAPLPFVCFNTHLMLCKHLRLKFLMHHYHLCVSTHI